MTDALLAFPIAFYMAKVASPRMKGVLVVAILMPLWSFYLVKVYAWRTMLSEGGIINWALEPIGLSGPGFGDLPPVWLVDELPVAPVHDPPDLRRARANPELAAERLRGPRRRPRPHLPARRSCRSSSRRSSPARSSPSRSPWVTSSRRSLVSPKTQFIGNVVYANITNNLPLASAFATVPILVMIVYLLIARRLGAFEHL